jgi:glycosyltransferase involved in cell wall biosynthesis
MPQVDIIIPAYKAMKSLGLALHSVIGQNMEDWRAIVIDDGSGYENSYRELCSMDSRISLIEQLNAGPAAARNRGILESSSQYIAFLDADDIWYAEKLKLQVSTLEENPSSILCYTDFSRGLTESPKVSRLAQYRARTVGEEFHDLLRENFILTSSVVVRRSALSLAGLFDANLRGSEDLNLWLRLAKAGTFCFVNSIQVYKKDHKSNLSSQLSFHRNQVKMLGQWLILTKNDKAAQILIQQKLKAVWYCIAYGAKLQGLVAESQRAYLNCARLGHRPFRCLLAAFWLKFRMSTTNLKFTEN